MQFNHTEITRFFIFLTLVSFITTNGFSQILGVNQPLFSDQPFFNSEFIKINNIKSISGSISSKKVRDIIRSKGLKSHYEFNENGKLTLQYKSHITQNKTDTAITFYEYNDDGKISKKRKSEGAGFYSYQYRYNNENNIIAQTYSRDENKFGSKNKFELKKKYIIKTDSFSYQPYGKGQVKKLFYNSYGIKYKEQTNSFDSLGYLTEERTKFIIGNNKTKLTYEYDQYGRLYKKHIYTNISQDKKTTAIYSYDEIGNVLEIKNYNEEKHISTKEFLYDEKTMLLSAIIIQDIASELLRIIKYDYTFFDEPTNLTELSRTNPSDTN